MSESKPQVAIVGLGLVGGSIGLALREAEVTSSIIGHDISREAAGQAKKMGAVDRTHWNLISACDEADLIILATPLDGIKSTMEAIGPELKPHSVVIDMASVKRPVLAWAEEILPETVHFVGANPILGAGVEVQGGIGAARADLFRNGLVCLVPQPGANADAVKLATDLVRILGAKPVFYDAEEHDGVMAAVDHLPPLLAYALLGMVVGQPTWRELRKIAGPAFEAETALAGGDAVALGDVWLANRDNIVRWIDTYSAALGEMRQALAAGELEGLTEDLDRATVEREKWMRDRAQGQWLEGPRSEMPERPSLVNSFLGTFWRRGPKKES